MLLVLLWAALFANTPSQAAEELAKAVRLGDVKMATELLAAGVNPDTPDRFGYTPLYYAAAFNQNKIVSLLLSYHANPNAQPAARAVNENEKDDIGGSETPLQYASELGNLHIVEELIEAGARVNAVTARGRTALHFASLSRHLDVMRFLLEKGADPNIRAIDGTSPIDDAAWRGLLDEIAILLARGARLNDPEPKTGATPINEAAYVGHLDVVRYLLQFHPDVETPDKRGFTPLENAARKGDESSALLLLAASNKTPDQRTVAAAINKDESAFLKALIQRGVSPDSTVPSGSTLLDDAAFVGATKCVQALLDEKADPNKIGRNGSSPLEDASLKGFAPIVVLLLDHGAAINQALYTAAGFGQLKVVELLLDRGANPNFCGKNQKTPYQTALDNEYPEVAARIKAHGGSKTCEHS